MLTIPEMTARERNTAYYLPELKRIAFFPDGASGFICDTLETVEDQTARREVRKFAEHSFLQQRKDYLQIRHDSKHHHDGAYRERCRQMVLGTPPPTWEFCLAHSIGIMRKREVSYRDTIKRVA